MIASGFANSWTDGEIAPEAWDRVEMQPVQKGCELAQNLVPLIQGPLAKRRGFWRNGSIGNPTRRARNIPFIRSVDDALMLEFGDGVARVWNGAGELIVSGGAPYLFSTPFTADQLLGLRWKQINDVIYFFHETGLRPQALSRHSNTNWTFAPMAFTNGPWLAENDNPGLTIQVDGGALFPQPGDAVALTASGFTPFAADLIGGSFRLRGVAGNSPGFASWAPKLTVPAGAVGLSNGRLYSPSGGVTGTTPPVHEKGTASDGGMDWTYISDGAGVVRIDAVTDPTHAFGVVLAGMPFTRGSFTPSWSESAYSPRRGWPSAWPALREERLAMGAAGAYSDWLDLTETTGFSPTSASFKPSLGTGAVIDTDAVRRRIGDDGSPVIWTTVSTYLVAATETSEFLVAGSVLDEPISPAGVVVKQLSGFGAAPVAPVRAHDGLLYVAQGFQTLRELRVDQNQIAANRDLTVLAGHIARRGLAELAWTRQPDDMLWIRTSLNGLVAYAYHVEQGVQGFTSQLLPPGWTVENVASLPGPGKLDTLWIIAHRVKAGVTQREQWMLSAWDDALFMDGADYYSGAPATVFSGLSHREGETVRVLADGEQVSGLVVTAGAITLPKPASVVLVGLPMAVKFKSLRLDLQGSLNTRQRLVSALVSVTAAIAKVGLLGSLLETFLLRVAGDVPVAVVKRGVKEVTFVGDSGRDPRITIEDDSAYDLQINSLKPKVQTS